MGGKGSIAQGRSGLMLPPSPKTGLGGKLWVDRLSQECDSMGNAGKSG